MMLRTIGVFFLVLCAFPGVAQRTADNPWIIEQVRIHMPPDRASLTLTIDFHNRSSVGNERVDLTLQHMDGAIILQQPQVPIQRLSNRVFATVTVPATTFERWFPESPVVGTLTLTYTEDGTGSLQERIEIPLRDVSVSISSMFLNGVEWFPTGVIYQPSLPESMEEDLQQIRDAHFSLVVIPAPLLNQPLLEMANRIGLFVATLGRPDAWRAGLLGWIDQQSGMLELSDGTRIPVRWNRPGEDQPAPVVVSYAWNPSIANRVPGNWSLLTDSEGNRTPLYAGLKNRQSPVSIEEEPVELSPNARLLELSVSNRYLNTPLDEHICQWQWTRDGQPVHSGEQRLHLPPGETMQAAFSLPPDGFEPGFHELHVRFVAADGRETVRQSVWVLPPRWRTQLLEEWSHLSFDPEWNLNATAEDIVLNHSRFTFRLNLTLLRWFALTRDRNIRLLDGPLQLSLQGTPFQTAEWVSLDREMVPGSEFARWSTRLSGRTENGQPSGAVLSAEWYASPFGYVDLRVRHRPVEGQAPAVPQLTFEVPGHLSLQHIRGRWSRHDSGSIHIDPALSVLLRDERGFGLLLMGFGFGCEIEPDPDGSRVTLFPPQQAEEWNPLQPQSTAGLSVRLLPLTPELSLPPSLGNSAVSGFR